MYYAAPSTLSELKEILDFSIDRNLIFIYLAMGLMFLLAMIDFNGIVIKLCGKFEEIIFHENDGTVTCGAGALLNETGK